ncbi:MULTISPECIES: hypothetical protein [unclassified Aerococcus]|uniref:hypothetical protein n=1 Tax=unclassified Aerococcus TaxID=2618060 RepID=UPI000A5DA19B|nr:MULTISPECIES: hypothetical protein [unclassified Aerococcus]MDK6856428.1 hypothetical protein [Aerococcus sp. UMB7533]
MKHTNSLIYLFLFFNLIAFVHADQTIQYFLLSLSTALFLLLAVKDQSARKAKEK